MFAWQATMQDEQGNAVVAPVVHVYERDGSTLAVIYNKEGAEIANPMTGSLEGFVQFWVNGGDYRVVGNKGGGNTEEWYFQALTPSFLLENPADWGDFQTDRFLSYKDGSVVAFNGVQFERDRSADIRTTFLAGAGWVPFGDVISYRHFAISNSGDMTARARTMHNYANSVVKPVSYLGLDRVTISAYVYTDLDRQIKVNTDVDFGGCIIDPIGANPSSPSNIPRRIFLITDPETPLETVSGNINASNLFIGSYHPTRGLYDESGYVIMTTTKQVPNRAETGTVDLRHSFWMEYGWAKQPLCANLTAHGNGVSLSVRKKSKRWVSIRNVVLAENGHNNLTLFRIERNQVIIDGFGIDGFIREPNSIEHLIMLGDCGNIHLKNAGIFGRDSTGGSYGFSVYGGAEIFLENVHFPDAGDLNTWANFTSNFLNGLYVSNSTVNRIDAHEFGWNFFMENVDFTRLGVGIGRGGGRYVMRGCRSNSFLWATRVDYGGYFEGASVEIYDCEWNPSTTESSHGAYLVNMFTSTYGVGSLVPSDVPNVTIDGLRVTSPNDANMNCVLVGIKTRASASSAVPVYAPDNITVRNVQVQPNIRWSVNIEFKSFTSRGRASDQSKCTLDNIRGFLGSTGRGLVEIDPKITPSIAASYLFTVENCERPDIKFDWLTSFRLKVSGCIIWNVSVPVGSSPNITIADCEGIANAAASKLGGLSVNAQNSTKVSGLIISASGAPYDLTSCFALSGVLTTPTGTAILPAGCTREQAWSGWVSP